MYVYVHTLYCEHVFLVYTVESAIVFVVHLTSLQMTEGKQSIVRSLSSRERRVIKINRTGFRRKQ